MRQFKENYKLHILIGSILSVITLIIGGSTFTAVNINPVISHVGMVCFVSFAPITLITIGYSIAKSLGKSGYWSLVAIAIPLIIIFGIHFYHKIPDTLLHIR